MTDTGVMSEQGSGGGGGPQSFGHGGDEEGDSRRLVRFLETLRNDLVDMIVDPEFMPDDIRTLAIAAYDAGAAPQFEEMIRRLNEDWDQHIEALARHGLLDVQLQFKLRLHGMARDHFRAARERPEAIVVVDPRFPTDGPHATLADAAARDYLQCSDIILESLSGALGGAGAAVIEFKKMIEWMKGAGWSWLRRAFGIR